MTAYRAGDICLVPFPFTDLHTTKKRPSLILAVVAAKKLPSLYIVSMITSQVDGELIEGDCLLASSKVRLAKLVTLEEKMLIEKLGSLHKKDYQKIAETFQGLFEEWI